MEFWELNNFEAFKKEVINYAREEAKRIKEEGKKRYEKLLLSGKAEGEKLKEELLKKGVSELEKEKEERIRKVKEAFEERRRKLIEKKVKEVSLKVLELLDFQKLASCFEEKLKRKYGEGKVTVRKDFLKFEGEKVVVEFSKKDVEELVREEIGRWLR